MNNIRWLIITPTLGKSIYLNQTIQSLKNLPGEVRHIVVCPEKVREKIKIEGGSSVVIEEKSLGKVGMYSAINQGLKAREQDYDFFCYLNDDDFYIPNIKNIKNIINNNISAIYYGRSNIVSDKGTILYESPYCSLPFLIKPLLESGVIPFMQPSMIVTRVAMEELQEFNDDYMYCGDFDFILRAARKKIPFIFINEIISSFRVHAGQLSGSKIKMDYEKNKVIAANRVLNSGINWKYFLMKFVFTILNIKSYAQRLITTKKLTSKQVFHG